MKVIKKVGGGVPFARKLPYEYDQTKYEADLKDGDIITITDAGTEEPNNFGGESKNFRIKTRNGEKKVSFNQKTINVLHDELGEETEKWIGKEVKVILKKDTIAGKKVIIPYFVVDGWTLDEYGDLAKLGQEKSVEYPQDEIDPNEIPF